MLMKKSSESGVVTACDGQGAQILVAGIQKMVLTRSENQFVIMLPCQN